MAIHYKDRSHEKREKQRADWYYHGNQEVQCRCGHRHTYQMKDGYCPHAAQSLLDSMQRILDLAAHNVRFSEIETIARDALGVTTPPAEWERVYLDA